ncbi:unnamed protein product [Rhizoctonia solani]|uniref:ER membrane protein complex subunit 7 beta-sandwich domain-containing protein n=1 Tax=Rhizoctonia solani TaxID=456999 RepID=A0A8H2XYI9_9AGAM|nr:unnamed protein product [Rhizoctonia solani]
MRFSGYLLASAVVSCVTNAWAANVEGKIEWNSVCSGINELKPNTIVVLDGGLYSGGVRRSGEFTIADVADGAYILSVLSPDYAFDFVSNVVIGVSFMAFMSCTSSAWSNASRTAIIAGQTSNRYLSNGHKTNAIITPQVRVDIDNNTVTAHPHVLGTPFELSIAGPTLPYPLALSARSKNVYFIPREGFNLAGMFQNPMMLMMVVTGVMVMFMPKLMDSMSEETKQELQQKQQDMFGIKNAPAPGLPKDLDVGSARAGLTGGGKGGKNARRKK